MPPPPSAPPPDGLPDARRVQAVVALFVALAMVSLDTAIGNVALPTIARATGSDAVSVIWVVNAYQLATVALLIPFASAGEVFGHRRVYLCGLALFTVASLACGLASSLPVLIAARALQGVGGAAVAGVHMAMLRHIYPSRLLGRAMGTNALVVGVSFTIGPSVASAILSFANWPWLFLVNVPIGCAAWLLATRTLPSTDRADHRYDLPAATLSAGLFTFLIFGLGTIAHGGHWSATLAEWFVALACGALLLWRQAGHPAPMLAVDLFRRPVFALSAATAVCAFSTQGLALVSLPFLIQTTLGYGQVATGLLLTPWPAIVAATALVAGRLSDRYPPGLLGCVGLFVLAVGMALLALLPAHASIADIVWRTLVCGAGFGFFQSPNLKALMSSAPPHRSGGASGIVATSRLLGQTLGTALVALCFGASSHAGPTLALWLGAAFAFAGSVASGLRLVGGVAAAPAVGTGPRG